MLEEKVFAAVSNIVSHMVNQQRATVIRQMRHIQSEECEAPTTDAIKIIVHVAQVEQQRELKYKKLMDEKIAQIQELQVFMLNATENLQKAEDKFDKLFKTLPAAMEAAKAELTEAIRQINVNSVSISSTDMFALIDLTVNSFEKMTAHVSILFAETKRGEDRRRSQLMLKLELWRLLHQKICWKQLNVTVKGLMKWSP